MQRFKTPLFLKLVLGLCWWMIHLFLSIHQIASHLLQVIESYVISIGLLESYRHLQLDKLRCLAVVVDSNEVRNTLKIKKLLRWLSDIGLNYVILYDMEGKHPCYAISIIVAWTSFFACLVNIYDFIEQVCWRDLWMEIWVSLPV